MCQTLSPFTPHNLSLLSWLACTSHLACLGRYSPFITSKSIYVHHVTYICPLPIFTQSISWEVHLKYHICVTLVPKWGLIMTMGNKICIGLGVLIYIFSLDNVHILCPFKNWSPCIIHEIIESWHGLNMEILIQQLHIPLSLWMAHPPSSSIPDPTPWDLGFMILVSRFWCMLTRGGGLEQGLIIVKNLGENYYHLGCSTR